MRATTGLEIKYQNKMRTTEAPKQFIKIAKADRPRGLSVFTNVTVLEVHSFYTDSDKNSASNS